MTRSPAQTRFDTRDALEPYPVWAAASHLAPHTFGTRLINMGVPQHVIQRLLGHASPQMTARYAELHDTTVRAAFGFRRFRHYRFRSLLCAGKPDWTLLDTITPR